MKQLGWWLLMLWLAGCSGEPDTGPGKIRWDRETCARCAMTVSDRHYAAQLRMDTAKKANQLFKFDDIGCAIIWLDQQPPEAAASARIWVADYRTGDWLDARKARFVTGQVTPMGYGLGATDQGGPDTLDYAQAREHVYRVEQQIHSQRGHEHPS